jgi:dTMP kinase
MSGRGRFIVFEGLDCSGSTTQANYLYERLIAAGNRVLLTSQPSSGPVGHLIRLLFSGRVVLPPDRHIRDRQFAYLFAADRFDHLNNPTTGILKYLSEGVDVISTRYVLSSLAYNVETDEEEAFVRRLNADFPEPDYLIFLDCPVELSIERMSISRPNRDTYENRAKLTRAASNYRRALAAYKRSLLVVDASLPREEAASKVFAFISHGIGQSLDRALVRQSDFLSD